MIISYFTFQLLQNVLRSAYHNSTEAALLREEIENVLITHWNQFMLISNHTAIENYKRSSAEKTHRHCQIALSIENVN